MFKTVTQLLLTGGQNLFARDFIVLVIETSLKASIKTQNTMRVHNLYVYVQHLAPGNKFTVAKTFKWHI